ncbi:MAG: polyphosphate polymerase domain-containing protein [Microbacterium sp.]|uniref:polyphosphate polymerase domain-containing protein n=1 Tax=Microbacterium sp. TaxID=51671 RepID=UPI0039E69746
MSALRDFDAVSLDELVAGASLLARVDRKYVVPRARIDELLAVLDPRTRVLEIDGDRDFRYESVYFDTPELLSFHLAARPRRRRFKLRTRTYVDTDAAYLELKTRGARGKTIKERDPYAVAERALLTPRAREEVDAALESVGIGAGHADRLDATLTTRYRRATLLAPNGAARATIDTHLTWLGADGVGFTLPNVAIIETKSPSTASDIDRLLWRSGHRPTAVSKYATGLAALYPRLPRNRWARLLRGPFSPTHAVPATAGLEEAPCSAAA